MNRKTTERWAPVVTAIGMLVLWQLVCSVFRIADFIFPSPLTIVQAMFEFAGPIGEAAWKTFWVTMLGFAISIVVGVLLGFLVGSSRMAYAAIYPLLVGFNAVPKAAIVPILIVWFGIGIGIGIGPGILTAFLISFFPITVNIATGLATLEPEIENVLRVLGTKRWDVLVCPVPKPYRHPTRARRMSARSALMNGAQHIAHAFVAHHRHHRSRHAGRGDAGS